MLSENKSIVFPIASVEKSAFENLKLKFMPTVKTTIFAKKS
jgi:hypothetical protein